jgi:large subunit ribosomal protein L16
MERPANPKYRKSQRKGAQLKNLQTRTHRLSFGSYGLKALQGIHLKASQMEAFRRVLVRRTRKIARIYPRTFPYKPVTGKPTKTRMGKGKGSVQFWVCPVKAGQVLFEVAGGISQELARALLRGASKKLPMKTKFITYKSASLDPHAPVAEPMHTGPKLHPLASSQKQR